MGSIHGRAGRLFLAYCIGILISYLVIVYSKPWIGSLWARSDFASLYTAAALVRADRASSLYDLRSQTQIQQQLLAAQGESFSFRDGVLPYYYPPFFVLLIVPFTMLALPAAYALWNLVNLCLLAAIVVLMSSYAGCRCQADRLIAYLITLAFFPVFAGLILGQTSFLVLILAGLTFLALKRGHDRLAGITLALGLFKPQFVLLFLLWLILKQRWQTLTSLMLTATGLLIVAVGLVGPNGSRDYVRLVREIVTQQDSYGIYLVEMHTLRGMVYRLDDLLQAAVGRGLPHHVALGLLLGLSCSAIGLAIAGWNSPWRPDTLRFDLQYALTTVIALLTSGHAHHHDLVMWILIAFLLLNYHNTSKRIVCTPHILAAGHILPLASFMFFGAAIEAQLNVLFMIGLAVLLWREIKLVNSTSLLSLPRRCVERR